MKLGEPERDTSIGLLVLAVFVAFLFGTALGSCTPRAYRASEVRQ